MTPNVFPVTPERADFVPKRRLISNVTVGTKAVVTTTEPHGYTTGQLVKLHVNKAYQMVLDGVQTLVTLDPADPNNDVNFVTTVDTTNQSSFSAPTFPPAFTQAQVVPITGDTQNIAGPLV